MRERPHRLKQLLRRNPIHSKFIFAQRAVLNKKTTMLTAFWLRLKYRYLTAAVAVSTKMVKLNIRVGRFLRAINRRSSVRGVKVIIGSLQSKHLDFFIFFAKLHFDLSICLIKTRQLCIKHL